MIKQLISDLAYENISLSQALTRAKLISFKVKNETFKSWLNKELLGYEYDDPSLPSYRKVRCSIHLNFGGKDVPVAIDTDHEKFNDTMNYHRFVEPIHVMEEHVQHLTASSGALRLAPEQCTALFNLLCKGNSRYGLYKNQLAGGHKSIASAEVHNIIQLTKQKLLDTLLELDSEFPNLENDFEMSKENLEKAQNIITNHIYGNNSPVNVAAGNKVEQRDIHNTITVQSYTDLEKIGVDLEDIQALKEIMKSGEDKPTKKSKVMKWFGGVAAAAASKGLVDNIPAISEFVHKLVEQI